MLKKIARGKVVVVGQGYVGLPLAMAACSAGYEVLGLDVDPRKVDLLNQGISYVEDVENSVLGRVISEGWYSASTSYESAKGFNFAIVTVPTPLTDGDPDLSFIESAALSLSPYVNRGCTVILESTTYPGTTEQLFVPALESKCSLRSGVDFYVGYSPERIDPGNQLWNLGNTPKVTSGVNLESREKVDGFYESLGIPIVPVDTPREAELTKLLENTFRHVNIALVNELAVFARALDVNIWNAIEAASSKPFGFMRFTPGAGVGGHCLPVDPSYLSWAIRERTGEIFRFVELANAVNQEMPSWVVKRARELTMRKTLKDTRVLLVGLGYKANSGDLREAPAIDIANLLLGEGACVYGLDPLVHEYLWPETVELVEEDSVIPFDLAIVVTKHRDVGDKILQRITAPVLDTTNAVSGANVTQL